MTKNKIAKEAEVLAFLSTICDYKPWSPGEGEEDIFGYYSKIDGSYVCFSNLYMDVAYLLEMGITEQIQSGYESHKVANIGFNPEKQLWYGWSHRAIHGFGIGSEVKKNDLGYMPTDMDDFISHMVNFWSDEAHVNVSGIAATNENGIEGVQITWEYSPEYVPNKSLHGTIGETFSYTPKKWGRGEWVAETLEDAKQMAIDFSESVS